MGPAAGAVVLAAEVASLCPAVGLAAEKVAFLSDVVSLLRLIEECSGTRAELFAR